jgi:hypothetical protein
VLDKALEKVEHLLVGEFSLHMRFDLSLCTSSSRSMSIARTAR